MNNRASKTVIALALAGAATAAFATNKDPKKDCFESPQHPHGTPACHKPPVKPPVTPAPAPVTQTTTVGQHTTVGQQTTVGVGVNIPVNVNPVTNVTTGPTNISTPVHVSAPTNVTTGPTNVDVTTGPTHVTTGPTTVNDNGVTTQTTTLTPTQTTTVTPTQTQNAAPVTTTVTDNSRTEYKAAASTAVGHAPAGATNLPCGREIRLGVGVQSLDHGSSVSVAIPLGQSEGCRLDNKVADLARSPNELDQVLKHEISAEIHPQYKRALERVDANVGAMVEANGGKAVTIQPGESHRLLGGNLSKLLVKPTIVTVKEIVTAPAPAAAAQGCTVNLNQQFEYGKATYTAKKTGAPLPPAPPASTCPLAELEKAQKAGFEAGQKAAAAPTARP